MRAENAGSAPERAGRGGLRGTVSASAAVSDACGALRLTEKRVPMKLLFKQRFFHGLTAMTFMMRVGKRAML